MNSQQTLEVGKHIWDSNDEELVIVKIEEIENVKVYECRYLNNGKIGKGCVVVFGSQINNYSF